LEFFKEIGVRLVDVLHIAVGFGMTTFAKCHQVLGDIRAASGHRYDVMGVRAFRRIKVVNHLITASLAGVIITL